LFFAVEGFTSEAVFVVWHGGLVVGLWKLQAFILPQREMNHKCREVDMRAGRSFSLPGGPVVESRNYEHMSRGCWVRLRS